MLLWASVCDLRTRRIPNGLTLTAVVLGLLWHGLSGGERGLSAIWLAGLGVAALTLPLWLARALGAGDVKLLGAVGALMGPGFLLWTLLGTIFAGGLMALPLWVIAPRQKRRMPLAPAIALGASFALLRLHGSFGR